MSIMNNHDLYCDEANLTPGCVECDNLVEQERVEEEEAREQETTIVLTVPGSVADQTIKAAVQEALGRNARVDIRRDDLEPRAAHQVARDATVRRRSALCTDPGCDIKLPGHSHYVK